MPVPVPEETPPLKHESLDVYRASLDFIALAETISQSLPRGKSYLSDQLRRAAASIHLNIAEGAGEFSKRDKARFYRTARRSANECSAVLDICKGLGLGEPLWLEEGGRILLRIFQMLIRLVKRMET